MRNGHYFKPVGHLKEIDVYRVLQLFGVQDPCIQHALKKLLVTGGRAGGKSAEADVQDAIDSLQRWQEMRREDAQIAAANPADIAIARACGIMPVDLAASAHHA